MVLPLILAAKLVCMQIQLEYDEISAIVEEEVSREAAQAYSAEGVPLYDAIKIVSRDDQKKRRIMTEVLVLVKEQCNRFISDVTLDSTSLVFEMELSTRRAANREQSIGDLLRSMTVNLFINRFFVSKNLTDLATKYEGLATVDIQLINKLLFTKMPPVYPA